MRRFLERMNDTVIGFSLVNLYARYFGMDQKMDDMNAWVVASIDSRKKLIKSRFNFIEV